jgi:hypothetical protein
MHKAADRPTTGRDLAAERVRAGLSQRMLADLLRVSPGTVAYNELKWHPKPAMVARIMATIEAFRSETE